MTRHTPSLGKGSIVSRRTLSFLLAWDTFSTLRVIRPPPRTLTAAPSAWIQRWRQHIVISGLALFARGEFDEARKSFERVLELLPESADATFYLATLHLLNGQLARGWNEYESRWRTGAGAKARQPFSQPQWKGEALAGAKILIHAEQGLGDTLNFVRYVPLVAARGGEVILEVQPGLLRLLSRFDGAWQVLSAGQPLPDFTWQCPMLSLPLALGTDLDSIPAKIPYIFPPPAIEPGVIPSLEGTAFRIGLVWSGRPDHGAERWRSVPLGQFASLMNIEGTTFYSLQMGEAAEQLERSEPPLRIVDLRERQKDFADTAAIVARLDLVISIDTSVAHLAGATGKPVWILLYNAPDWRWLLHREDSPWYPTARLFRQSTPGNWQDVLTRIEIELRKLIAVRDQGGQAGS